MARQSNTPDAKISPLAANSDVQCVRQAPCGEKFVSLPGSCARGGGRCLLVSSSALRKQNDGGQSRGIGGIMLRVIHHQQRTFSTSACHLATKNRTHCEKERMIFVKLRLGKEFAGHAEGCSIAKTVRKNLVSLEILGRNEVTLDQTD